MDLVFNDETTTLEKKIELVTEHYIDLITEEPGIPLFIMTEIRNHGARILEEATGCKHDSSISFYKAIQAGGKERKSYRTRSAAFLMNMMGLILFPFISNPMIKKIGKLNDSNLIN